MGAAVGEVSEWASSNGWALLAITVIVVLGEIVSESFRYNSQKLQAAYMRDQLQLLKSSREDMSEIAKTVIAALCRIVTR
ncbi:MAG: hypothetical protein JXA57_08920 [Armatimonadetes bacterium]|nr:hypothetical protein [Armatimonadota bacterium]